MPDAQANYICNILKNVIKFNILEGLKVCYPWANPIKLFTAIIYKNVIS
jgi:hypothetical protein